MKLIRVLVPVVYGPENIQYLPGCNDFAMDDATAADWAALALIEIVGEAPAATQIPAAAAPAPEQGANQGATNGG